MSKLWPMLDYYSNPKNYDEPSTTIEAIKGKLSPLIEKWKRIAEKQTTPTEDAFDGGVELGEIMMAREVLEDLGVAYTKAAPRNQS